METNPAMSAFVAAIRPECVFAQVWIRRHERGFELRHIADRDADPSLLKLLTDGELRAWAQFSATGMFRPLKSAPNLRAGWRLQARDEPALESALNKLYPGAVADWFAAQKSPLPVTSYRDFTNRQSGMYRITTFLDDATAGAVIRSCCHADFCLKRRLWTVAGTPVDAAETKSVIPCLEPCPILLEFARKTARLKQDDKLKPMSVPEAEAALAGPDLTVPETDFNNPFNPRRLRFVLESEAATVTKTGTDRK